MEERIEVFAPQFGIGKKRPQNAPARQGRSESESHATHRPRHDQQRPASSLCVAELIGKGWAYRVVSSTKTHAVVEFTSPVGDMREERTILRGMLPEPQGHHGRPVLHLGKTHRDHENGSWQQHRDNKAAHADLNRGHAIDHGAGTKGGGSDHGHHEKGGKGK